MDKKINEADYLFIKNKLVNKQTVSAKDMFELADINKNRTLEYDEFKIFLKHYGINLTETKVQSIFSKYMVLDKDTNKGSINEY